MKHGHVAYWRESGRIESARRLAALEPVLVCFGHGPPLRDIDKLSAFIVRMPH